MLSNPSSQQTTPSRRPAREFKVWKPAELRLLLQNIINVGHCSFEQISSFMPGRNRQQCKNKWQNERRRIEKHGSALHDWKTVSVAAVKDCLAIENSAIRNTIRSHLLTTLSQIPPDIKYTTSETYLLRQRMLEIFEQQGVASAAVALNSGTFDGSSHTKGMHTPRSGQVSRPTKRVAHDQNAVGSHAQQQQQQQQQQQYRGAARSRSRASSVSSSPDKLPHQHDSPMQGPQGVILSSQYGIKSISASGNPRPFRLHPISRPTLGSVQLVPVGVHWAAVPSTPFCIHSKTAVN
eukprot:gnl/Dysnectes_brevis/1080_a1206_3484.p1 GENE.gnl/Dysnectes_brevis/1080_a1206_3484~~gnl/Dysnectes_brevis/1080_a1206_3484.p1  ORF type:complete len:293 (-),score=45.58 gnl/Dysnectes_brevis/1080_a1206_3484:155-1033(-)